MRFALRGFGDDRASDVLAFRTPGIREHANGRLVSQSARDSTSRAASPNRWPWKSHVCDRRRTDGLEIETELLPTRTRLQVRRGCCESVWLFCRCCCSASTPTRRMSWTSPTRPSRASSSVTRTHSSCFTHHGETDVLSPPLIARCYTFLYFVDNCLKFCV